MEQTASQLVIQELLSKIQKKEIQVGDKLPSERELSGKLNISRSRVREAMSALNMMGMIKINPKGRTVYQSFQLSGFINTLSVLFMMEPDFDHQLKDYRLCIEKESVRLAAQSCDTQELVKIVSQMQICTNKKTAEKLDVAFHLELAKCSKNLLLVQSTHAILSLIEHSVAANRSVIEKRNPSLKQLLEEHQAILKAVVECDAALAVSLIEKHLKVEKEGVLE